MNAVVAEAQVGEARARTFALLQLEQGLVAVFTDPPQLVELGVVAGCDDSALAQQRRRLRHQRALQQVDDVRSRARLRREFAQQWRVQCRQLVLQSGQEGERIPQLRQVARPRRAQRDPREDALHVAHAGQQSVQGRRGVAVDDRLDRLQAQFALAATAQRPPQPAPQFPAAHRGGCGIQHREQCGVLASREAGVELEVASCRGVDQQ